MTAAGALCEILPEAAAAERFPGIATRGPALLEPDSAVTAADVALEALVASVPEIRTQTRVTSLSDDGRRVTLQTNQGPLSASVVIVCTGPWTPSLLSQSPSTPRLEIQSTAALEQVTYLSPSSPPGPEMPIFLFHENEAPYGLPVPGSDLYKTGLHQSGNPVDPDHQDQDPDPALSQRLEEAARRHLPAHDPIPVKVEHCIYDNTPDEDFIVDRIGQVVVGSGTSGHGFKYGLLLGEGLAALAMGEPIPNDLTELAGRFRINRFRRSVAGT
jgi:sarcosine oxidase